MRTETLAIALNHCEGLKAQLVEWLKIMSEDPNFAPAEWVMESMWTRIDLLQKFISSLDLDEVPESLSKSLPIELSTGESFTSSS